MVHGRRQSPNCILMLRGRGPNDAPHRCARSAFRGMTVAVSTEKNRARRERRRLRERKGSPSKKVPVWQIFETLVGAVERQWAGVPGVVVTQKAMVQERSGTETREVDILVCYPVAPQRVFRLG